MSDKAFGLRDLIRVAPDKNLEGMTETQMIEFKDSALGGPRKRGLLVTFDLSHSGRKINNRIYPPWGQRDGANSWTEPFRRPIILNHDNHAKNTIGRFVSVTWQSLEAEAIDHLGGIKPYLEVKKALDSNDAKLIYKTYNKYGLFRDKKWPGVGKLVAQALITDSDAVERFVDGRYLTFSAGSRTNAYTCLVCGSGWHEGDVCDHRPGMTDEDGNTAYFMTGLFLGDEGSVVNAPADTMSQVRNLEMQDFEITIDDAESAAWLFTEPNEDNFMLTDSTMEVASMTIELKDLMELEPETVINKIVDGSLGYNFEDLKGDTQMEIQWLIRIHDSMHHRYDATVRGEYGESIDTIPMGIFDLHGKIHMGSTEKGFRDSLINGDLDHFDAKGTPSEEYVAKRATDSESDLSQQFKQLKDDIMSAINEIRTTANQVDANSEVQDETNQEDSTEVVDESSTNDGVQSTDTEEEKEVKEDKEEEVATASDSADETGKDSGKTELDIVDDADLDWFTLGLALDSLVGEDAKLSTEDREKLDGSAFCGPDRSFPISDRTHYTAALKLITHYKGPGNKDELRACIERKGEKLGCVDTKDTSCNCNCGDLKQDYAEALKQVDALKGRLTTALESHAKALNVDFEDKEDLSRLDILVSWFDNIETAEESSTESKDTVEHIQEVINPSEGSSENKESSRKLGDYEQKTVTEYKSIRDKEGEEAANYWYFQRRRYLPPTFDLTKFI
jgi:hypothetical protein